MESSSPIANSDIRIGGLRVGDSLETVQKHYPSLTLMSGYTGEWIVPKEDRTGVNGVGIVSGVVVDVIGTRLEIRSQVFERGVDVASVVALLGPAKSSKTNDPIFSKIFYFEKYPLTITTQDSGSCEFYVIGHRTSKPRL